MNLALLGDDPAVLPLIRAMSREATTGDSTTSHETFSLECAALVGSLEPDLRRIVPSLRVLPSWDGILVAGHVDAVLVCGWDEPILEAARQIAAAGKTLVILPNAAQGSTWIYELGLIRDEGRTQLVPVFPDRLGPGFQTVREAIGSGILGRVLYVQVEREIGAESANGGPALLTMRQVEDALLHDADLLRGLAGDYSRVSAVHSGAVGDRIAAAGVTLQGEKLPEATWTVRGTARGPARVPRWKLIVAGEKGEITATAENESAAAEWTIQSNRVLIPGPPDPGPPDARRFRAAPAVIDALSGQAAGSSPRGRAEWADLVRAFEIVDAARSSVRRRRPVDIHFETTSERNIFKSHMTAAGCLLLTFTLVGIVFLLLVMPLFDIRSRTQLEAERAGAIVRPTEFATGTADLNAKGTGHVRQIAGHMEGGGARFPVLLEESGGPPARQLDERRRDTIVAVLKKDGLKDANERVQIGPVVGEWYPQVLQVVRILVFTPLALFLLLQLLVLIARPATK